MAGVLDRDEELVWDPLYPSLQTYAKDFDYDLMGQRVRRTARFFADPQSHIERWVREQQMEIIAIGASLMLSVIIIFICKALIIDCVLSSLRSLRYFLTLRSVSKKYRKMLKTCDYENVDADDFAAEVYRKVVETCNLYKYHDRTDMTEYESGRFNWEANGAHPTCAFGHFTDKVCDTASTVPNGYIHAKWTSGAVHTVAPTIQDPPPLEWRLGSAMR
ncbi:hypothetical protein TcWFU_008365 [Taenia crassiceps]|uniref:Uncharacterized protein n=1 Tax=Taenia crassiceps TaxID=6207 RepID=A0ABR4QT07_9CEST